MTTPNGIPTQPGAYVPSGYGHYGTVELIELAISWGYKDNYLTESGLLKLTEAYRNDTDLRLARQDVHEPNTYDWSTLGVVPEDEVSAWCYDTSDDIESWLNEHAPDHDDPYLYWVWTWEDGEFGLWLVDDNFGIVEG